MAKNTNVLYYILIVAALTCSAQLHAGVIQPPGPLKGELRQRVAASYTKYIGVREKTGNNDGTEVEHFLKMVGLAKGNPWCAAYVYTCFIEAGINNVPKSGYSPNWFPDKNTVYKSGKGEPLQADVFGIYFSSKGRIAHVGFIDEWKKDNAYCLTVEGNTNEAGSREGDGVYRKRRLKRQIHQVSRWVS